MADNTQVNTGAGDTIRDKDRAGVKSQVVVVDVSDGAETEVLGLGKSLTVRATSAGLTTSVTAYTIGDQLGTELSLAGAVRTNRGAILQSARITDAAKVLGACDLLLFDAATTPAADNAANAWSDADMLKLLGIVHFNDVVTSANNIVLLPVNLPLVLKPASGTTIYGNLVTRTANAVFGAVTDIEVLLGLLQD